MSEARPWLRLRAETAKAYRAFQEYYRMDAEDRSLDAVSIKLGKHISLMKEWSSKHGWVKRAEAWDVHLAAQQDAAEEERRRQLGRDIVDAAAKATKILIQRIEGDENVDPLDPHDLNWRDAGQLLSIVSKVHTDREKATSDEHANRDIRLKVSFDMTPTSVPVIEGEAFEVPAPAELPAADDEERSEDGDD